MRRYFEGWYLKHQSETESLALIPSYHYDRTALPPGPCKSSPRSGPGRYRFPTSASGGRPMQFTLGENQFSARGCTLRLDTPELSLDGSLGYGPLAPPPRDVMGPFRFVPGLQCRHSVFSLGHSVTGQ